MIRYWLFLASLFFLANSWPVIANAGVQHPASSALAEVLEDANDHAPGAIIMVTAPGFEFYQSTGYSNPRDNVPMQLGHTLRVGSITKTYVAALAAIAVDEGRLDLDDAIDEYLSTEMLEQLPAGPMPTIRQLLNHTSGIPDYYGVRFYLFDWRDRGPLTTELVLHALRGKQRVSVPGAGYSYSNTNYHLLALILEHIYEASLEALLSERIFEPLDLQETYYGSSFPPGDDIHGFGSPLWPWDATYTWQENSGPDGGLFATATDLETWLRALFSRDGDLAPIGRIMVTDAITESERRLQGLGVEIMTSRSGVDVVGHTGGLDGYMTAAFYIPENDAFVLLHINRSNADGFSEILSQILRVAVTIEPAE